VPEYKTKIISEGNQMSLVCNKTKCKPVLLLSKKSDTDSS
jgi:hypothetical protein